MKKIKYLLVFFSLLIVITGCTKKETKKVSEASKNTSITEQNVKSYRAKVSIKSKDFQENYIVFNTNNKNYSITTTQDGKDITISIKNGKKKITDEDGKEYTGEIKYDYTNTDIYLTGINLTDSEIDSSELKIGKETYTKYNFKISKDKFNEIMKPFNLEAKTDGNGYTYIDKNNHVYLVNYNASGINVNVSYTNIKTK